MFGEVCLMSDVVAGTKRRPETKPRPGRSQVLIDSSAIRKRRNSLPCNRSEFLIDSDLTCSAAQNVPPPNRHKLRFLIDTVPIRIAPNSNNLNKRFGSNRRKKRFFRKFESAAQNRWVPARRGGQKIRKRYRPRPMTLPGVCPRSITDIDALTPQKVSLRNPVAEGTNKGT